jgi:L-alanine-DL-glutamate epimerase-like enolase superfamily enzyme
MFEFMELDQPLIHIFKAGMLPSKEGEIELFNRPGLGIELDRRGIEK